MTLRFCTSCGEPLDADVHFCTGCGAPVAADAPVSDVAPPPPDVPPPVAPPPVAPPPAATGANGGSGGDRTPLYVAIAVVAALVLIVGIILVTRDSGDDDQVGEVAAVDGPSTTRLATTTTTSSTTTSTTTTTTRPPTTLPPATAPATVPPQAPDRSQDAIDAVEARMCDTTYITEYRSEEIDFELYRVRVHIVLDSGDWWAEFDVDYATEFGPEISPATPESAEMLC